MANTKHIISKRILLQLLNPHLQKHYNFEEENYSVSTYESEQLFFNINRFDLIIKYIYVDFLENKYQTNYHKEIYKEHIGIFSNNSFKEGDGYKSSLKDYYDAFQKTIESIKTSGFDKKISILPIDENFMIIDGAHRLSAAYYFKQKIATISLPTPFSFNSEFFKEKGMQQTTLDFGAYTYCKLNTATRIVNLFPISKIDKSLIENVLKEYGNIYLKKTIALTQAGQEYVVKEMYLTEHWIGSRKDNYAGARNRAKISFDSKNNITVYVYIPNNQEDAIKAKTKIRELINKGNYPIHINDTHEETIRLAQIYFNKNTLHFANYKKEQNFTRFSNQFKKYKEWIKGNKLNGCDFCIDASSTLSVYGLREGADLDFLYSKSDNIDTGIELLDCHNAHAHYYGITIDDIIYNPNNHFYFEGYKFVSIQMLRKMKAKRNEQKDTIDVLLIDSIKDGKIQNALKLFNKKLLNTINKFTPKNIYKFARIKAHRIIPINSKLWKITKSTFYFIKKIKNNE